MAICYHGSLQHQAFVVNANTFALTEGASGDLLVNLAFNPLANVQVTIASSDIGAVDPTPTTLTFTDANYAVPQAVNLRAVQDADFNNETGVVVTVSSPVTPNVQATVNVADDETQSIILTPATVNLTEGGAAVQFFSTLAFDPVGTATVSLVSSDPGAASLAVTTLTFDSSNFAAPQAVAVAPVDDADIVNENVVITASSSIAVDASINVVVTDDDTPSLIVNQTVFAISLVFLISLF